MLISSLRALRSAQQKLPAAAPLLSAAWRGLATDSAAAGGSGGGGEEWQQQASPGAGSGSDVNSRSSCATTESVGGASSGLTEHTISIDRSGLYNPPPHSHGSSSAATAAAAAGAGEAAAAADQQQQAHKEPETELVRHLKALIRFQCGPISLAEFMSEALTNPQHGYYSQRDVFGAAGDFVTSPEISQMFGEMVGIWCVAAWQQLGCPPTLQIVELGPGRGTLMADLLRGTAAFRDFSQALRVSMVEVSPHLRTMQWRALRCQGEPPPPLETQAAAAAGAGSLQQQQDGSSSSSTSSITGSGSSGSGIDGVASWRGVSAWSGAQVSWHRSLEEVQPEGPTLYIAHEFLDALPVHQFQKTERGWCERLVDVASEDSPLHLRIVLSPGPTPAARLLLPRRLRQLPPDQAAATQAIEICPQSMALAESLAQRVAQHGGAALIIDYGQDAPYESSLQAIRRHQFVGLLEQPGSADISNRVDYSALRSTVADSGAAADCLGPIPQAHLLLGLGIEARLQQLMANATPTQAKALQAGFRRLVGSVEEGVPLHEEGMGYTYQAFCIAQQGLQPWPFGAVIDEGEEQGDEEDQEEGAAQEELGTVQQQGQGPGPGQAPAPPPQQQ